MGRPRQCFKLVEDFSVKAGRAAKPGDRRSFNLERICRRRMPVRTTFNSRARGRGGKMKPRSIVLLFASLLLISTFPAYAQNPNTAATTPSPAKDQHTGSISGTVFDPDGRAVAGAQITLLYAMAALETRETNAQGQYRFDELRAGTYEIVGASPGFNAVTGDMELHAGEKLGRDQG